MPYAYRFTLAMIPPTMPQVVVAMLKNAGAVPFCKTNVPQTMLR